MLADTLSQASDSAAANGQSHYDSPLKQMGHPYQYKHDSNGTVSGMVKAMVTVAMAVQYSD